MYTPPDAEAQTFEKIIEQAVEQPQQDCPEKLAALQDQGQLHLTEKAVKKSAAFPKLLIGQGVDHAADNDLTAVC